MFLRVETPGLCHSDVRVYAGEKYARLGIIPGHEMAGTIVGLGEGVEGFQPGQRVTFCPIIACGRCYYCQRGLRQRCLVRKTLGYDENGGLAEFMLVLRRIVELGHVLPLPSGLSPEIATLTEPLACVVNSLETCRLSPGGCLVLLGAGPMGLLHLLLARALGIATIGVVEPQEERRDYARRFGATFVAMPEEDAVQRQVLEATDGLGADAVVVTTGLSGLVTQALALVRRQGVVNLFGGFPPDTVLNLDPNAIHYGEVSLTGSQNASLDQYRRALRLLTLLPQAAETNTHHFTIDEAPAAYTVRQSVAGLKSLVVV
jgi:L-iditol 2-dehydrogenase